MTKKKVLSSIIAICLVSFLVTGCKGLLRYQEDDNESENELIEEGDNSSPKIDYDNKIKISMRNPSTLNPILNMDETVDRALKIVFSFLVDFNENDEPVPNLAKSWSLAEGGTVVDIKLDTSIKWHDGESLKADDVIYTLKTIQEAENSPYKPCVKNILSYTASSEDTVTIVYKEPFSGYAHGLYFPVIPSHIEDLSFNPIGTGPYALESFSNNRNMLLKNNNSYFKGSPKIEEIEVIFSPDTESDLNSFDQGLIDVVSTDVIDWEKYAKNKKSNINEYMTLNYDYIGINFNKPALQEVKTRQALLYASNREYILEKIYLYHGQVVDVPVSPSSWLYNQDLVMYESNVDKAKELLEGNTLELNLLVNKDNRQRMSVASALQKMYKDVGITLNIIEASEEEFMEKVQSRQFDLFLGGWNLSIIPDLSFAFHSSYGQAATNYGNYSNEQMDSILREAFNARSNEELREEYLKMQTHFSEQLPYISLYFRTAALLTNEKIKGDINPHHMNQYQNIHMWYIN
ncbi:MAG: peptide ABC transporter substrate-binding protein [Epulopiscium sp.]|nr:peptide ABC transporter substrate-binding protein [Candidatus Epulonipiscium sp.]